MFCQRLDYTTEILLINIFDLALEQLWKGIHSIVCALCRLLAARPEFRFLGKRHISFTMMIGNKSLAKAVAKAQRIRNKLIRINSLINYTAIHGTVLGS